MGMILHLGDLTAVEINYPSYIGLPLFQHQGAGSGQPSTID